MKVTWQIVPVSDKSDDFHWMWEEIRNGNVVARSPTTFRYYNECVEDAQKRGYAPPRMERLR
jgi:hypothetical protein